MEGTAYVDSFQDFDRAGQKFPLLPEPVPGVLSKSILELQFFWAKYLEEKNKPQQGFAKLTDKDLQEIRASNEVSWVLADRYGVSKSCIVRARAGLKKSGRPLKIPKL